MKTVMIKLLNFQEVIAKIEDDEISDEDFLNMNFETIKINQPLTIVGMAEREHNGEKFAVPEFQPLNAFSEKVDTPIVLRSSGMLYCHFGNTGIRDYYDSVLAQITGGIVKPPEKSIVMPH